MITSVIESHHHSVSTPLQLQLPESITLMSSCARYNMRTSSQPQRWSFIFFCLLEIFSFIGGSTTSGQEVFGTVGESFTFKTGVPESGSINYGTDNIGHVFNKQSDTDHDKRFKNRLHWDSQTGFFTLTDLRINDSGSYTVQSIKGDITKQEYQLEIYERVSAPQVINTSYSSSENEVCTLLCSVKNVRGLKLYWYKDKVQFNETSSSSSLILDLPLEIKKTNNHIICEASNPVSNRSTTVDITDFCSSSRGDKVKVYVGWIRIVAVVCAVIVLAVIIMAVSLMCTKDWCSDEELFTEVQYSAIPYKNI